MSSWSSGSRVSRHPLLPRHSQADLCQTPAAQSSPNSVGDFQRAAGRRSGVATWMARLGLSGKVQMPSRLRLGQDHHVEQESAVIRFKFTPNCATEASLSSRHDMVSDSQLPLVKIADIAVSARGGRHILGSAPKAVPRASARAHAPSTLPRVPTTTSCGPRTAAPPNGILGRYVALPH